MNRKEVAEQISSMIANNHPNLEPEEIATLIQAEEELKRSCANCLYLYTKNRSGGYCGMHEMGISQPDNWFCAEHKEGDNFREPF